MLLSIALLEVEQGHGGGGLSPFDPTGFGGLLWTWLIFLFGLPLMWKVVMGPITKALEERDEQAARAITEAEKAREETARAKAEVTAKVAETRAESARLIAEARERASAVEKQIVDEANAKAAQAALAAQAAIAAERDKAIAAIRDEVVELSIHGARAVIGRNVGGDDDRRMVSDMVGKLKAAKR